MAGRLMAQPVYAQLRKSPCVSALMLRANFGHSLLHLRHKIDADCGAVVSTLARRYVKPKEHLFGDNRAILRWA